MPTKNNANPWMISTFILVGIVVGVGLNSVWKGFDNDVSDVGVKDVAVGAPSEITVPTEVVPTKSANEIFKAFASAIDLNEKDFTTCLDSDTHKDEVQNDFSQGKSYGVTGTPGFFVNGRLVKGAQPYESFVTIFEEELNGTAGDVARVSVSTDDDPYLGKDDAPIVMLEFSDYQCPYCTRFYTDTLPQIKKNYIETGKVKFVYRDYPLNFHQHAEKAAEAAECAGDQGKYFEYHNLLFERSSEWTNAS